MWLASTMLSVSNGIGLAVLTVTANDHAAGLGNVAHAAEIAEGMKLAFCLASRGIVISLLVALARPGKDRTQS